MLACVLKAVSISASNCVMIFHKSENILYGKFVSIWKHHC